MTPESNTPGTPKGIAHVCRHCNYQHKTKIVEYMWGWLRRCPGCGAYDWEPEPRVVE